MRRDRTKQPPIPPRPIGVKLSAVQWGFLHKRIRELATRTIEAVFINLPAKPAAIVKAENEVRRIQADIDALTVRRRETNDLIQRWQWEADRERSAQRAMLTAEVNDRAARLIEDLLFAGDGAAAALDAVRSFERDCEKWVHQHGKPQVTDQRMH